MRQKNWEKLIDEILEQGMGLVWNEETEKYEKKATRESLKRIGKAAAIAAARQFPQHHRILHNPNTKKSEVCA